MHIRFQPNLRPIIAAAALLGLSLTVAILAPPAVPC